MKHGTHFARFSEILTETDLQQTPTRTSATAMVGRTILIPPLYTSSHFVGLPL